MDLFVDKFRDHIKNSHDVDTYKNILNQTGKYP